MKNRQYIHVCMQIIPDRIDTSDMAPQHAIRARLRRQMQGDVVGVQPISAQRDKRAQRVTTHQGMQRGNVFLMEVLGNMHGCLGSRINVMTGWLSDGYRRYVYPADFTRVARIAAGTRRMPRSTFARCSRSRTCRISRTSSTSWFMSSDMLM